MYVVGLLCIICVYIAPCLWLWWVYVCQCQDELVLGTRVKYLSACAYVPVVIHLVIATGCAPDHCEAAASGVPKQHL